MEQSHSGGGGGGPVSTWYCYSCLSSVSPTTTTLQTPSPLSLNHHQQHHHHSVHHHHHHHTAHQSCDSPLKRKRNSLDFDGDDDVDVNQKMARFSSFPPTATAANASNSATAAAASVSVASSTSVANSTSNRSQGLDLNDTAGCQADEDEEEEVVAGGDVVEHTFFSDPNSSTLDQITLFVKYMTMGGSTTTAQPLADVVIHVENSKMMQLSYLKDQILTKLHSLREVRSRLGPDPKIHGLYLRQFDQNQTESQLELSDALVSSITHQDFIYCVFQ